MSKVHYRERCLSGEAKVFCGRVPNFSSVTYDPRQVTCSWCLKFLAELARMKEAK